ncbi:MAG: FtsW/RodA/SpoVE family cell cycle protein [Prevotellaceae bacterium]|jgi:cell division protein FtsW (lipid II flippase)|nr:FtsW/RodA/SpoVE family cell cycle protein [Prevotellaceae bacterium]
MKDFFKQNFKGDSKIWAVYVSLIIISILAVFIGSSKLIDTNDSVLSLFFTHCFHLAIGFIFLLFFYHISGKKEVELVSFWQKLFSLKSLSFGILAFCIIFLAYLLLSGQAHQGAARSFFGFFQPSEFAKLSLIVVAAYFIDRFQNPDFLQKNFKWFCVFTFLPIGLVFPMNLSMAVLIAIPIFLMMVVGQIPWKLIGIWVAIPVCLAVVIFFIAKIIPPEVYNKTLNQYYIEVGKDYHKKQVGINYEDIKINENGNKIYKYNGKIYDDIRFQSKEKWNKYYIVHNGEHERVPYDSVQIDKNLLRVIYKGDTIYPTQRSFSERLSKMPISLLKKFRWETWRMRFANFWEIHTTIWNWDTLDPEIKKDFKEDHLQVAYSQCAINEGKFIGSSEHSDTWRKSLPDGWSDYIYALIIGELGWAVGIFVIFLYVVLLYRGGVLIKKCDTVFSSVVIVGASLVIALQAFLHILVNVNLFPVTGQTLPLISKGGSSIVIMSAFFGLMLGLSKEKDKKQPEKKKVNTSQNEPQLDTDTDFEAVSQPSEVQF